MKITTNDCREYIVQWIKNNQSSIPLCQMTYKWVQDGDKLFDDGTNPKKWKRTSIKKIDGIVLRFFHCEFCYLDSPFVIVYEKDNIITHLDYVGDNLESITQKYGHYVW